MLPTRSVPALREHLATIQLQHAADLEAGTGTVALPDALAIKYPSAPREWRWQWVFPATRHYRDRLTGAVRRHHLHDTVIQRAVRAAAARARITKPVPPHLPPQPRHPPPGRRLRHPNDPGAPRPSRRDHHHDLHPRPQPRPRRRPQPPRPLTIAPTRPSQPSPDPVIKLSIAGQHPIQPPPPEKSQGNPTTCSSCPHRARSRRQTGPWPRNDLQFKVSRTSLRFRTCDSSGTRRRPRRISRSTESRSRRLRRRLAIPSRLPTTIPTTRTKRIDSSFSELPMPAAWWSSLTPTEVRPSDPSVLRLATKRERRSYASG